MGRGIKGEGYYQVHELKIILRAPSSLGTATVDLALVRSFISVHERKLAFPGLGDFVVNFAANLIRK